MKKGQILVADDDNSIRIVISQALTRAGFEVKTTSSISTLWNWLQEDLGDVLISDVIMPDGNAFELLPRIKSRRPDLPVILISAQNTFMTAIRAQEAGAWEYLPKPFDIDELVEHTNRALSEPKNSARSAQAQTTYLEDMPLVGRSPAMQEIYRSIARLMESDLPVLLSGETGTGKSHTARVIHDFGNRKMHPFVAVNLSVIAQDQVEAELFGQPGKIDGAFEKARNGTIYLEEIGDLPISAQQRLLRSFLKEESSAKSTGSSGNSGIRIVSSTTRDLQQQINAGTFREDLYFRLNMVPITLPPLRERTEDIPDLARHFLRLAELEGTPPRHLDNEALQALKHHLWPGNIRELENLLLRICTLYPQETISKLIVRNEIMNSSGFQKSGQGEQNNDFSSLRGATEFFVNRYFSDFENAEPPEGIYHKYLAEFEHPVISAALTATNGNQIKAAKILGINRNTLRKKIATLGIKVKKVAH